MFWIGVKHMSKDLQLPKKNQPDVFSVDYRLGAYSGLDFMQHI